MKKNLIIILGIFLSYAAYAQTNSRSIARTTSPALASSLSTLRTIKGWQHGLEVSYETKKGLEFGLYSFRSLQENERPAKTFNGVRVGVPLLNGKMIKIGGACRVGAYDQRFVNVITSLTADVQLNSRLSMTTGFGKSNRYPAFDFRLNYRFAELF